MDAILDLAARAVSVIVLIQDTLVEIAKENGDEFPLYDGDSLFPKFKDNKATIMLTESFIEGGIQINYISLDDPLEARKREKNCQKRQSTKNEFDITTTVALRLSNG